jgi:hypothetical protein
MSISSRYRHSLTIKRLGPLLDEHGDPILDDYSQPVMGEVTVATVAGLLQPRRAREIAEANQTGAVIGEYVAYMDPLPTIGSDCWIERDGIRYDVLMDATEADAAGLGDHYEVGCRRVG